jgi:hypothetical protein
MINTKQFSNYERADANSSKTNRLGNNLPSEKMFKEIQDNVTYLEALNVPLAPKTNAIEKERLHAVASEMSGANSDTQTKRQAEIYERLAMGLTDNKAMFFSKVLASQSLKLDSQQKNIVLASLQNFPLLSEKSKNIFNEIYAENVGENTFEGAMLSEQFMDFDKISKGLSDLASGGGPYRMLGKIVPSSVDPKEKFEPMLDSIQHFIDFFTSDSLDDEPRDRMVEDIKSASVSKALGIFTDSIAADLSELGIYPGGKVEVGKYKSYLLKMKNYIKNEEFYTRYVNQRAYEAAINTIDIDSRERVKRIADSHFSFYDRH